MGYGAEEYSRYTVTADSVDTVHRRGSLDYKDLSFRGFQKSRSISIIIIPLSTKTFPAAPPSSAVCW